VFPSDSHPLDPLRDITGSRQVRHLLQTLVALAACTGAYFNHEKLNTLREPETGSESSPKPAGAVQSQLSIIEPPVSYSITASHSRQGQFHLSPQWLLETGMC
jgi:hypothetical protein